MLKHAIVIGAAAVAIAGPAHANSCQAKTLACATTMPAGGFCECTAGGKTEGGKAVEKLPPGTKINSTSGGCGSHPNAPGCKPG